MNNEGGEQPFSAKLAHILSGAQGPLLGKRSNPRPRPPRKGAGPSGSDASLRRFPV